MLTDPKTPARLEISGRAYILKRPTVADRVRWRKNVLAAGGRRHGQFGLLDALRRGVETIMADSPAEIREALVAKIEAHRDVLKRFSAAVISGGFDADPDGMVERARVMAASADELSVIESEVANAYPRYAVMAADEKLYPQIAGIEAARLLLLSWEGFDVELVRDSVGVAEQSLAVIPEWDLALIAEQTEALCGVSAAQRKNSGSPPAISTGGETSRT